jgi:hydroxyacylglutathione hydrolase
VVDLVPLVDAGLGNSAYLVDLGDGGALVVDPERDPRPYLHELAHRQLTPRYVVETHLHADFISGGRELAARGARLLAPRDSALAFPHEPLTDGDEVDLGGLRLQVIATPGHTPEHLAYLLLDGDRPAALFSGGTLMAGGVARTDLLAPDRTEPLARAAYRSITQRLLTLPDDLPVLPTHGAGSFCAAGTDGERTTTIGRERTTNPLLVGDPDEETFIARLLAGFGSYPPYFLELREENRAGPVVYGPTPAHLPTLSADEVEAAVADGAEVVDVRNIEAFAAGHLRGALSNPWRPQFATWLGWLAPRDRPIVVVADDDVVRQDLVWAARTIGYDDVVGELAGGIDAWRASGRVVATTLLVGVDGAAERQVVDVRQDAEFASGHVAHATHVELGALTDGSVAREAVPEGPVLLHCGHGERAMTAASLLERAGHRDVAVLAGGPEDLGDLRSVG